MKTYDPRMHTAEHILNGTMVKMFNKGRAFSSHVEKKKSKCDYKNFTRNLTEDDIAEIERRVNEVIKQNLDVSESFIPFEEAKEKFNLSRLPEGEYDEIRIIKVGNYDACPCIGSHVKNTSEIGEFKITSANFNNGILRVRFKLRAND